MSHGRVTRANVAAAIASIIPGLGHLMQDRVPLAVFYFGAVGLCYSFYYVDAAPFIGVPLHVAAIFGALLWKPKPELPMRGPAQRAEG